MENTITVLELIQHLQSVLGKYGNIGICTVEYGGLKEIKRVITQTVRSNLDENKKEKIAVIE